MKSIAKKLVILLSTTFFVGFFVTPVTLAVECDGDADGYITISNAVMKQISPTTPYDENGNYKPEQWQNFFNVYKSSQSQLRAEEVCDGLNFKKGAEPVRCDALLLTPSSNVYDPSKVATPPSGSQLNPGAFDVADNAIDENCDGVDEGLIQGAGAEAGKQIGGLVDKMVTLLSRVVAVVSVLILIWGGILYATAAGDEGKVSKARKAIIGAVIGLIVGLLAPTVVNLIVANLK